MTSGARVLLVDDDAHVLDAFRRVLGRSFGVETAEGGAAGLERLGAAGPFAVVVSDLRMPGMDGVDFLARVRDRSPETVRMMLTGQADLEAASRAVNEGNVFRFLCKPCAADALTRAITACVEQYRLVTAERDLLERTLAGTLRVTAEVLELVDPVAFGAATRMKRHVRSIVKEMGLVDPWSFEAAALLSPIGAVGLPAEDLDGAPSGAPPDAPAPTTWGRRGAVAARMLAQVPRLEPVADILRALDDPEHAADERSRLGAFVLAAARELDRRILDGSSMREAAAAIHAAGRHPPAVLAALARIEDPGELWEPREVDASDLAQGMVLEGDVRDTRGILVARRGQEVTSAVLERLRGFARGVGLATPIRARVRVAGTGRAGKEIS